ncbi:MAG: glycoside hydrolase/deacetylase [Paenibacillus sp.]|uniref:hypothetical protein n=1 Tax=Paenibacillus sp. GCM10012303 TaxID=3317340 RepID=UPI0029F0C13E|nr:glycoside hydrolase/deacetylase [Paenibacillus sp.]
MTMAKLGVLLDENALRKRHSLGINTFERFIVEILGHAGIPFDTYASVQEAAEAAPDLLIAAVCGSGQPSADTLWTYAEQGGTLIAYGGLNALARKLGYARSGEAGKGYARLPAEEGGRTMRFLSAEPWIPLASGDGTVTAAAEEGRLLRGRPDGEEAGPLVQRFAVGAGMLERWSVPIPHTIVGLQQGLSPVLADGVPAPDGTAAVNDGVFKADDVAEIDWMWDRSTTEAGDRYFPHAYADDWRETLIGALLRAALAKGLTLPFVGYWPDGVRQVALLSLDSDHTQDMEADTTLRLLRECGIPATWCMMAPWYSRDMYERIEAEGHELAFHYNAVPADGGAWSEEAFAAQLEAMKLSASKERIVSNKNHLTRIEGWGELYRWCERHGIESEQSRGNSKKGSVGFLYGTAHPYFPLSWADEENRFYDVLQIGFHYGDFLQCDPSLIGPLLDEAARVEGVAHFVFHQIHIDRKAFIRDWLREYARVAAAKGFTFWTGSRINEWERTRRRIRISGIGPDGNAVIESGTGHTGAVVWIPVGSGEQATAAEGHKTESVRFGVRCRKQLLSEGD